MMMRSSLLLERKDVPLYYKEKTFSGFNVEKYYAVDKRKKTRKKERVKYI